MAKKTDMQVAKVESTQAVTTKISNDEMFKMYRDVVAPGTNLTATQFAWFIHYCQQRGFDPLGKDIFLVPRSMKQQDGTWKTILTPQSSIDAFRKRATASNAYEGQDGPHWCGPDGVWKDIWLAKAPPSAAKVGVMRTGFRQPVWGIALYSEYVQRDKQGRITRFWEMMPANQLAKCAESLALRKAFPDQFGGIYTAEEMAQAEHPLALEAPKSGAPEPEVIDAEVSRVEEEAAFPSDDELPPMEEEENPLFADRTPARPEVKPAGPPTADELNAVRQAWKKTGLTAEKTNEMLRVMTGGRKSAQWSREDFNNIVSFLGDHYEPAL